MIICFECSPETSAQLDSLVKTGNYKDLSEAIKVAIANQALLHKRMPPDGSVILASGPNRDVTPETVAKSSSGQVAAVDYTSKKIIEPSIPDVFRLSNKTAPHNAAPMPDDVWAGKTGVPLERWIFGQYNKLFPLKASCRALSNILLLKDPWPNTEYIARYVATHAVELGRYLLHHDLQYSIPRDDRLSTAFPTPNPVSEKSRERYAKQFVINVNKSGQSSSLLVDFKFVNFTREKNPRLALTEPGWHFALLRNPILEQEQQDPLERFGQRERDFLIEHIITFVPAERVAYRTILTAVTNGEDTPEKLGTALSDYVREKDAFTPSYLAAQRSGAISRMVDIGLLTRSRDGVRVTYKATQSGQQFLSRTA